MTMPGHPNRQGRSGKGDASDTRGRIGDAKATREARSTSWFGKSRKHLGVSDVT
jgi:hypothetical protein